MTATATALTRGQWEHEQVLRLEEPVSGLSGFLAIHSTALGPALGGIRICPYASEDDALADALRLSRAMTYKTALAELSAGGGKTVIIEYAGIKRAAVFEALGDVIQSLGGKYLAGPDVGVTAADLAAVHRRTQYVADESSAQLGNIAEHTAIGAWHGLRACLDFAAMRRHGARAAIQGVGGVGSYLAGILAREGFHLVIADVDAARAEKIARECGAKVLRPEEILSADCDVLAPCALGGMMNSASIPGVKARIVCGSANNTVASMKDADALHRRGILYAPDYLVNAGGVIRGADFYLSGVSDSSGALARIYDRTKNILEIARRRDCSPARVADELAEARWRGASRVPA